MFKFKQLERLSRSALLGGAMVGSGAAVVLLASMAAAQVAPPATSSATPVEMTAAAAAALTPSDRQAMLKQYCGACHNDKLKTAGMSVEHLDPVNMNPNLGTWEKILRRVSLGEMPPKGMRRPVHAELTSFSDWLEGSLDGISAKAPDPGRATLRRLNRVEYANAVRDLLGIDVDVSSQLPADDSGYGFDNIADVLSVSPTLIDRYMLVAGRVGRLATGVNSTRAATTEFAVAKDPDAKNHGIPAYNERSNDALPVDSRGGGVFKYYAPYDGNYSIRLQLNPNTLEENEVLPASVLELKTPLKAGMRTIEVSFARQVDLDETVQKLYSNTDGQDPLVPRFSAVSPDGPPTPTKLEVRIDGVRTKDFVVPSYVDGPTFFQASFPRDLLALSVTGPENIVGPGDTPSRRKIFICHPTHSESSEKACASRILTKIASQAYRRPITKSEAAEFMAVYATGRQGTDFDHGVEAGIEAVLVSPKFLFMQEPPPANLKPGAIYRISDRELATRLSLFLWSSIPDAQLLSVAQKGKLHDPAVLQHQISRMLADPRGSALTKNFAGQWLYLRNVDIQRPDTQAFPNFDMRLRTAMRTETEMFFDSIVRENRSLLDFIKSDYTFLNQRLAEHYGIKGVEGPAFRRVALDASSHRGGLLGQASILTVTSYGNRTSVVKRGKWILDNLLAAPPPPPPPNIPALDVVAAGKTLTARQQMELHRANPVCGACHNKMDPLGLALENYDAVGAWRTKDTGLPVDASAVLPDGTTFDGPVGLEDVLMSRKTQFTDAFIERLMTYALGRGLEAPDMPAVRTVRRKAAADGYRMQTVLLAIAQSLPFTERKIPKPEAATHEAAAHTVASN